MTQDLGRGIDPLEIGPEVEMRGFESLFAGEHTNYPVSSAASGPPAHPESASIAEIAQGLYSPLITLTAAAARTTHIRLGTAVSLLGLHDPIIFAKDAATLDRVSGGRFELGIGYGWNSAEFANHGIDPTVRRAVTREKVLAVRELWTADVARYDGKHVRIAPTFSAPKPVQDPAPPIWLGAAANPRTFAHLVEFADGWMARSYDDFEDGWLMLQAIAQRAGRDPSGLRLTVISVEGRWSDELLERAHRVGAHRLLIVIPSHLDRSSAMRRSTPTLPTSQHSARSAARCGDSSSDRSSTDLETT